MGGVNYFIKIPRKLERSTDEKFQKTMNNFKNNDRNSTETAQKQRKNSAKVAKSHAHAKLN